MEILVIDGMGGGIGKAIIEHIQQDFPAAQLTAVGTNSIATAAMRKAGATLCATGENAVIYNAAKAQYIIGAIGIITANSMHGEISPKMAEAVSSSAAHKILIPMEKCVTVLGVAAKPIAAYISEISAVLKTFD